MREEIRFGLKHCGVPKEEWDARTESAASLTGLSSKLDEDPLLLTRSKRQRVALASVLATGPEILVLDEPTSAQDDAGTTRIMEIAKGLTREGKTVILVSHDMELVAKYATRVLTLIKGRIVRDCAPSELFDDTELLSHAALSRPGVYRIADRLGFSHAGKMLSVAALADHIESAFSEASR